MSGVVEGAVAAGVVEGRVVMEGEEPDWGSSC